jgi:hypothetical protein
MVSTEPEPVAAVNDTLEYAPDEILMDPAGIEPGSVVPAGNVAVIVCPTARAPVALVAKLSDHDATAPVVAGVTNAERPVMPVVPILITVAAGPSALVDAEIE